jgi:peptide deformylase
LKLQLVTDEASLRKPCFKVSLKQGKEIGRKLISFLREYNRNHLNQAIGLAAPQLGITAQVCIIANLGQFLLVNPVITEHSETQNVTTEGCLSLPGKRVQTYRWEWVKISADNFTYPLLFSGFDAVVAQHEIGHLFSELIYDRVDPNYRNPILGC